MSTFAAAMTGMGTGAISSIQVFGDSAQTVIRQIFRASGTSPPTLRTGNILIGTICEADRFIDQVTLGCEGPATFAIHCHGNPLVVETIMQLLRRRGATLLTPEQFLAKTLAIHEPGNTIRIEAQFVQPKIKTLQGAKIVAGQVNGGLTQRAKDWLGHADENAIDKIKVEATEILQESQAARFVIYGCTAVLAGPPNSGKSTLLNYLAGKQKSIVTDIEGTTRDWVEATCQIGPLSLTLIDTAGLVRGPLLADHTIEQAAQRKTIETLSRADLVLLVLDGSRPTAMLDAQWVERLAAKRVITVLNKADLPAKFDTNKLPGILSNTARISAKDRTGIEELKETIQRTIGAADFDSHQPVCFTARQEILLQRLTNATSSQQAASSITELLRGPSSGLDPRALDSQDAKELHLLQDDSKLLIDAAVLVKQQGKRGECRMKKILFSQHALDQLHDRGATREEVESAIRDGEAVPAKKGRSAFRKNFRFGSKWKDKHYEVKQVMPIVAEQAEEIVVVTVYVFYFGV